MKGNWVQDTQTETWHLIVSVKEDIATWCGKVFDLDAPLKTGDFSWAETLHDECVRRSGEL